MKTKNKKLLDPQKNKEYYSKSDGNFMPLERALYAHKYLDRVEWMRNWVHEIASRNHISVGCKDGYECITLTAEGVECIGIDPSEDAIDEAKLKAREAGLDITFMVGFGEQMPDDIRADSVSCMEVLEHVVSPAKLMNKLSKVGRFVMISTPDAEGRHGIKDSERNQEHVRLYTKEELDDFMSGYGTIIESVKRDGQLCIIIKSK